MSARSLPSRLDVLVGAIAIGLFIAIILLTGLSPERWVDNNELKSSSWLWRTSVAAADTSLALLVAALAVGPIKVLRGGRPMVHVPVRRTLGVWAGGFTILHVSLAIFVHARAARIWSNWLELSPIEFTSGQRGLANWLGLAQLAIVVGLLWLSRDVALRRLGPVLWKRLQRSTYVLAGLVAVHALLYQAVEARIPVHSNTVRTVLGAMLAAQLVAAAVVWRRRLRSPA